MTNYQRDEIEELKRRNPIDEILADHGHHPVRIRGDQREYKSPFREEGSASFHVDLGKAPGGLYYDFGTGKGGDVITLVQELKGLCVADAIQYLRDRRS